MKNPFYNERKDTINSYQEKKIGVNKEEYLVLKLTGVLEKGSQKMYFDHVVQENWPGTVGDSEIYEFDDKDLIHSVVLPLEGVGHDHGKFKKIN